MQASTSQWGSGSGTGIGGGPRETPLGRYAGAIRRNWPVVLLVTAIVTGLAALVAQTRAVKYAATAEMLVTPLPSDETAFLGLPYIRDTGEAPRTLQTAATLVDSQRAAAATARALGGGWTAEKVDRAVDVNPQGQSSVVDVTARDESPSQAAALANRYVESVLAVRRATLKPLVAAAIRSTREQLARVPEATTTAQTLADRLSSLQSVAGGADPTLSISQRAVAPQDPVGSSNLLIIALAVVVGLALGALAALLVEGLRPRRIADEDELRNILPLPVLTRVPLLPRRAGRRKGASPLATPPMVREGFRTLQVQLELEADQHRALLVTSASSGDGKTTSVINFALELAASGNRVVLMDLDLRKPDVAPVLGLEPTVPVGDVAAGLVPLASALVEHPAVPGLHVLPVSKQDSLQLLEVVAAGLPALVDQALEVGDYVLIDSAPLGEVSDALPLIKAVDDVILVAQLGSTRVANVDTMRDLLARVRGDGPLGWVVIGASPRLVSSSYYYAGAMER